MGLLAVPTDFQEAVFIRCGLVTLLSPPKFFFSTFTLGRKGVFNPKFEIICSGFSFHSSEPRWEKGLNFVNSCYPKLRERWE